ncbi:MAG: endolytic transglycosylase MltG [Nitrospirota bacterium]
MITTRLVPWLIVASLALGGIAGYQVMQWAAAPAASHSDAPPTKIVLVPEGASFQQVAALLEREQIIKSRSAFLLLGKANDADRKIHPGEYELNAGMLPAEILAMLVSGRVVLHQVTIPEGFTMTQIAETLGERGLVDQAEFLRLAQDREFIRTLGIEADSLEGYLFPDTYRFARRTKAGDALRVLVDNLWQVFTPELRERAKQVNLSIHEVLTLASVIEKETSVDEERPLISAVFHNRLRKNIPLQSDPTVIYGLAASFDGNLRRQDLDNKSPYNTYRVKGLPPGPIASPGARSIRAALYPAPAPYLYFVSRNDGTHQFSSTLEEHNRAVEKYQRRPFRRVS